MNIYKFAQILEGREYGKEITRDEEKQAKELGFVVIFGYSDDNAEIRGAINDEVSCYEGGTIYLDEKGVFEECDCECSHSVLVKEKCKTIEAVWCGEEEYAWTYKTDIPYATFDIVEEEERYCRGIVFDIKELLKNKSPTPGAWANVLDKHIVPCGM